MELNISHHFQLNESEKLIKSILKRIQHFQRIRMTSNSYLQYGKTSKIEKEKIEQITKNILFYEQEINHKFNLENLEALIDNYNKAVEYYSALNDLLYDVHINNLHQLLKRKDVQMILSMKQDSRKVKPNDQSPTQAKQENTFQAPVQEAEKAQKTDSPKI